MPITKSVTVADVVVRRSNVLVKSTEPLGTSGECKTYQCAQDVAATLRTLTAREFTALIGQLANIDEQTRVVSFSKAPVAAEQAEVGQVGGVAVAEGESETTSPAPAPTSQPVQRPRFKVVYESSLAVIIRDTGHGHIPTVASEAETIFSEFVEQLAGRALYLRDRAGYISEFVPTPTGLRFSRLEAR